MTNLLPRKPGLLSILNKHVNALRNAFQTNTLCHQLEDMYVLVLSLLSLWLWDSRDGDATLLSLYQRKAFGDKIARVHFMEYTKQLLWLGQTMIITF